MLHFAKKETEFLFTGDFPKYLVMTGSSQSIKTHARVNRYHYRHESNELKLQKLAFLLLAFLIPLCA